VVWFVCTYRRVRRHVPSNGVACAPQSTQFRFVRGTTRVKGDGDGGGDGGEHGRHLKSARVVVVVVRGRVARRVTVAVQSKYGNAFARHNAFRCGRLCFQNSVLLRLLSRATAAAATAAAAAAAAAAAGALFTFPTAAAAAFLTTASRRRVNGSNGRIQCMHISAHALQQRSLRGTSVCEPLWRAGDVIVFRRRRRLSARIQRIYDATRRRSEHTERRR
jgi:hypothetical protein